MPVGVVTFLFTDIQGSTQLLRKLGDRYSDVLRTHNQLLRDAFRAQDGWEVDTQGDAFFVCFTSPHQAVAAAADAQRALCAYPWPEDQPVLVRMRLHTGEPVVGGTTTWAWTCTARHAPLWKGVCFIADQSWSSCPTTLGRKSAPGS